MKNNLIDFSKFKTLADLQRYANDQFSTILKMQAQAEEYQSKIEHLEELLRTGGSAITVGSNELEIARIELNRLYQHSLREPLDEKQIRSYKIYTDCLLAIQGKTPEKKPKQKEEQLSTEDLINLALQAMPEADGN
jgi:hypothetical protein